MLSVYVYMQVEHLRSKSSGSSLSPLQSTRQPPAEGKSRSNNNHHHPLPTVFPSNSDYSFLRQLSSTLETSSAGVGSAAAGDNVTAPTNASPSTSSSSYAAHMLHHQRSSASVIPNTMTMFADPNTEEVKPYACTFCSFRTKQAGNLKTHMRTHTGERPFACPYCPYRATQKIRLKTHLLSIHKELVFSSVL